MKSFLFLFFVFVLCFDVVAQCSLTKQEIIDRWKFVRANSHNTDTVLFSLDSRLQKKISYITNSLQTNGIDSIIVYVEAHPGSVTTDRCVRSIYPEYAFLIWHGQSATHIRKVVGECEEISSLLSDSIFNFWSKYGKVIETETVMPVIFGAEKISGGGTKYSLNVVSHEPQYSLFLKSFTAVKRVEFDRNSITNKEGLFYEDNVKSKSVGLWQRIVSALEAANLL